MWLYTWLCESKRSGTKKFNQLLYKMILKKRLKITSQINLVQDYDLNKIVTVSYWFSFFSAEKERAVSCIHKNMILFFFKCTASTKTILTIHFI